MCVKVCHTALENRNAANFSSLLWKFTLFKAFCNLNYGHKDTCHETRSMQNLTVFSAVVKMLQPGLVSGHATGPVFLCCVQVA